MLNGLNEASLIEIQAEMDAATLLFEAWTPEEIEDKKGEELRV